ncbi:sensor histidine kinase [Winogradskyella luteola]|uniref:histidine kinase n=1 Tax=Winogradskyella luteola TaxID=2828330 RepID=A0A9X1JR04_9FLAO|nr:PAS domain-containing sensor histidine kinase [Winogradskyella luteola]MBV7270354.1 PAS domain-containing sensor histidine kinase [Winogradskyella luteola]
MKLLRFRVGGTAVGESNQNLKNNAFKIGLQISNVGVWDWNTASNDIFYSEESIQMLGYNGKEFKNKPEEWDKRVHPDDKASYYNIFIQHLNGLKDVYEHEYRILCKDGRYKWILDQGKVIDRDSAGNPIRITGTHTDITSRKKAENQLKKNLQLITNQNKRLHNFTHIVSHNLKTHIGNLKNILELYDEAESDNERKELLNHLNTVSGSLTKTIVNLDDIISIKSKSETTQLNEPIDLFECTDNIIESLKLEGSKKSVKLFNALKPKDTLFTNRAYLESIIYNLISNGIKYADNKKSSQVIISSIDTSEAIKIIVADNGIGIDTDKYKNQLFEMYQTFHGTDRKDSSGIGLYLTRTQVEALGGTIEVESRLNEGSTFTLTFKK